MTRRSGNTPAIPPMSIQAYTYEPASIWPPATLTDSSESLNGN